MKKPPPIPEEARQTTTHPRRPVVRKLGSTREVAELLEALAYQAAHLIKDGRGVQFFLVLEVPGGARRVAHRITWPVEAEAFAEECARLAHELMLRVRGGLEADSEVEEYP